MKMNNIIWPTTGLATKIPKPNSILGKISVDESDSFSVYIGNTSQQEFENYIKACQEMGFVNNYSKTDTSYSAENNEKYELTIEFKGNKTMYISVDAPEENESKEETKKEDENHLQIAIQLQTIVVLEQTLKMPWRVMKNLWMNI